jgi:hypothetical protein
LPFWIDFVNYYFCIASWWMLSTFSAWASRVAMAFVDASLRSWLALLRFAISCSYLLSFFFMLLIYHRIDFLQDISSFKFHW